MNKTLVLVHTIKPLVSVFDQLCAELLPKIKVWHILDEPMLEKIRLRGSLASQDADRLFSHVTEAIQVGTDAILVTCSTISPLVDQVQQKVDIPVVKIDEAMIAEAVQSGTHLGVIATNQTTLQPTQELLISEAQKTGKQITTELVLVDNALEYLLLGRGEQHDELVINAVLKLSQRVDVVILAQASMARALTSIPEKMRVVPVLSSPHQALLMIGEILFSRSKK
jgi:Asp/Glu/hydantoin racemase